MEQNLCSFRGFNSQLNLSASWIDPNQTSYQSTDQYLWNSLNPYCLFLFRFIHWREEKNVNNIFSCAFFLFPMKQMMIQSNRTDKTNETSFQNELNDQESEIIFRCGVHCALCTQLNNSIWFTFSEMSSYIIIDPELSRKIMKFWKAFDEKKKNQFFVTCYLFMLKLKTCGRSFCIFSV